jgi:hypothetical protein
MKIFNLFKKKQKQVKEKLSESKIYENMEQKMVELINNPYRMWVNVGNCAVSQHLLTGGIYFWFSGDKDKKEFSFSSLTLERQQKLYDEFVEAVDVLNGIKAEQDKENEEKRQELLKKLFKEDL